MDKRNYKVHLGDGYNVWHLSYETNVGKNSFVSDCRPHTIAHVDRSGLDWCNFPDGLDGVGSLALASVNKWRDRTGCRRSRQDHQLYHSKMARRKP
jgi:hypothetical protein